MNELQCSKNHDIIFIENRTYICNKCKKPASRSHRLSNETSKIFLGHKDSYEPLCKKCYENVK